MGSEGEESSSSLPGMEEVYEAKDALMPAVRATGITGAAGIFAGAVQATLTKQNIGAMGAFTRYGATAGAFAGAGFSYEFFKTAAANLRQKEDSYNEAIGGFFSGAVLGIRWRSIPAVVGYGASLSIIMSAFSYQGGNMFGWSRDPTKDEFERKEEMRKNRRRPVEETVKELGEGRGIYAPGYEDRRKERIKQRYGIDV